MIINNWPPKTRRSIWDTLALKAGAIPGYCVVCGRFTVFRVTDVNLRENVVCRRCGSFNRQRQVIYVLLSRLYGSGPYSTHSIRDIPKEALLWSAETTGSLHRMLSLHLGSRLISSEFLDPSFESGRVVGGVMHMDMQRTHLPDGSLDFILSGDVLEHMPRPQEALTETYRILKPGGYHVFTVPFYEDRFLNEKRVSVDEDGRESFLLPPIYHGDPVRPEEGALVYNIFAPEMLCEMERAGFEASLLRTYSPFHGLLGTNGLVLVARKPVK